MFAATRLLTIDKRILQLAKLSSLKTNLVIERAILLSIARKDNETDDNNKEKKEEGNNK